MEGNYQPGFYRDQHETRHQPSQQQHQPQAQQHAAHYPLELPISYHTTAQHSGFGDQPPRTFPMPHPGPGVPMFRSLYHDSGPMHLTADILHHAHLQRPPVSYGGQGIKLATPPANYESPTTTHGAVIDRTIQPSSAPVSTPETRVSTHSTHGQLPKTNDLLKLATPSANYEPPVTTHREVIDRTIQPIASGVSTLENSVSTQSTHELLSKRNNHVKLATLSANYNPTVTTHGMIVDRNTQPITAPVSASENFLPSSATRDLAIDKNNRPLTLVLSVPSSSSCEEREDRSALVVIAPEQGMERSNVPVRTTEGGIQGAMAREIDQNDNSSRQPSTASNASPLQDKPSSPPHQKPSHKSTHFPSGKEEKVQPQKPQLLTALNLQKNNSTQSTPSNITLRVGSKGRVCDGVVAKQTIEKGVEFGPLTGMLLDEGRGWPMETTWEIGIKGKVYHYIDGGTHWMSHLQCAHTEAEQNMEAYQYCGDIYFRTTKVVEPGSELRVFYSEDYGKCIGRLTALRDLRFDEDTKMFPCSECEELFTSAKIIMRHLKCEHTEGKPKEMIPIVTWKKRRKKKYCSKQLPGIKIRISKLDNQKFKVGVRKDGIFKCRTCNKEFQSSGRLQAHELFHDFSDGEVSVKGSRTRTKRKKMERPKMFECNVCKRGYATRRLATRHEREEHGYPCRFCSERFLRKKDCIKHESTHQAFKTLQTAEKTRRSLRKMEESAKIQPSNPAEDEMKDMLGSHTSDNQKLYKCRFCPKRYSSRGSAERHEMEIHTQEGNFKCRYCPKVFGKESRLKEHLLVHKHVYMYCCAICPKSFASESALNNHQGEHTGLKPFKCEVCGRGFRTRKFAQKHKRRIHEDCPNRFFCSVCNKGFTSRSNLKVHERRHKGIRPYVCLECGRGFSACNSLAAHKQAMHDKEKKFSCQICGQSFALNHHFNRHMAKHRLQEDPDIMNSIHIPQ